MSWLHPPRINELVFFPGAGIAQVESVYPGESHEKNISGITYVLRSDLGTRTITLEDLMRKSRPLMSKAKALRVLGVIADRVSPVEGTTPAQRNKRNQQAIRSGDPIDTAQALRELLLRASGGLRRVGPPIRISNAERVVRNKMIQLLCGELHQVLGHSMFRFNDKTLSCEEYINLFVKRLVYDTTPRANPARVAEHLPVYAGKAVPSLLRAWKALGRRAREVGERTLPQKARNQIAAEQGAILRALDGHLEGET